MKKCEECGSELETIWENEEICLECFENDMFEEIREAENAVRLQTINFAKEFNSDNWPERFCQMCGEVLAVGEYGICYDCEKDGNKIKKIIASFIE